MIFPEYQEDVEVWRYIKANDDEWVDPVWTYIATIKMRFEPVQGTEAFLNNQNFSDVTEMGLCDYSYRPSIKAGDGLREVSSGIERTIVGEPEDWKWGLINSHSACKCQRKQWSIG